MPPTRSTVRFWSARSSFTCIDSGTSSMSSRKSVPPCAISKRPGLSLIAPVKAPRSWPKSSVSIRFSENSAQLTATNGWCRAAARVVQQVGDDFLAGAALAGDDHAAVAAAHHLHEVEDGAHARAVADDDVVEGNCVDAPWRLLIQPPALRIP